MFRAWRRFTRIVVTSENVTNVAKRIVDEAHEFWPDYEKLNEKSQVECFRWIDNYIKDHYVMELWIKLDLNDEIIRLL